MQGGARGMFVERYRQGGKRQGCVRRVLVAELVGVGIESYQIGPKTQAGERPDIGDKAVPSPRLLADFVEIAAQQDVEGRQLSAVTGHGKGEKVFDFVETDRMDEDVIAASGSGPGQADAQIGQEQPAVEADRRVLS